MKLGFIAVIVTFIASCGNSLPDFDASDPARGPGSLVGNSGPITDGNFAGGNDTIPVSPRPVTPPGSGEIISCDDDCVDYCDSLALENPVNQGLCRSSWGVGLSIKDIDTTEACRRLYVDMLGRFPSQQEVQTVCNGRPWGDIVSELIDSEEFVKVNRQLWADVFLYNTQTVSVERIYDMDILVEKLVRGHVGYGLFGAVVSAHPAMLRQFASPEDMAAAVYELLMGRPAFDHERSDLSNLYRLWTPGYIDHLPLNMRLPDTSIEFHCVDEYGEPDPETLGDCISTLWGVNQLTMKPDWRAGAVDYGNRFAMWSGMLSAEEWEKMQLPGRLLALDPAFWETIVDRVIKQYLGYDLGTNVPEVRNNLVQYLIANSGDFRSLHFAIATSAAYLQSAVGSAATDHRWTYGPHKQIPAEAWIDSITQFTGVVMSPCDHRLTRPNDFLEAGSVSAYQILTNSDWGLDGDGILMTDYADLARTLGGCPENESGGRFKIVSILTTSAQLNFVNELCDPAMASEESSTGRESIAVETLLPAGVGAQAAVDVDLAGDIFSHQTSSFLGRTATAEDLAAAQEAGTQCAASSCTAEQFARAACFSILSSSDFLFY